MSFYAIKEIKDKIEKFPKKNLIHLPTPFRKLENLTVELGGPEIFIKRDDLTGLAFGGNKSRKMEFIVEDMLSKQADVVITWGSIQSNWCLQTAAVARQFGLKPILILFKSYDLPDEYDGNLLLDFILDAEIRFKAAEKGKVVRHEDILEMTEDVAREVREWGHTPYIAPIGGSMPGGSMELPLGAISYVNAFIEMFEQSQALAIEPTHIVHATGSGATQAGLIIGAKASSKKTKILGISVSDKKQDFAPDVLAIARATIQALNMDLSITEEDILVFDEYIKEGYGIVNRDVAEAIRLTFLKEGIVLDPVYTGKAMVALLDLAKKGCFAKDDKIVFFHTGGAPALFPNKHKLLELLRK